MYDFTAFENAFVIVIGYKNKKESCFKKYYMFPLLKGTMTLLHYWKSSNSGIYVFFLNHTKRF